MAAIRTDPENDDFWKDFYRHGGISPDIISIPASTIFCVDNVPGVDILGPTAFGSLGMLVEKQGKMNGWTPLDFPANDARPSLDSGSKKVNGMVGEIGQLGSSGLFFA